MDRKNVSYKNAGLAYECIENGEVPLRNFKLVNDCSLLPLDPIRVDSPFAGIASTADVY